MLIPLGILAQSRQAVAASDFVLLETQVLGSSAASVTFSGLSAYSSTYKHLQIRFTARNDFAAEGITDMRIRLNGDTGTNYRSHRLVGNGSSVTSGDRTGDNFIRFFDAVAMDALPANVFSAGVIDILDPYISTKNTTLRALIGCAGVAEQNITLHSGLWLNTAALTAIELGEMFQNLRQGSRFSLYGVR